MEKCKICGVEKKNLKTHIRMAHKMTMEEYDNYKEEKMPEDNIPEEEFEEIIEDEVPNYVRKAAVEKPDKSKRKLTEQSKIYMLLDKHELTLSELENMIENYKETTTVTENMSESGLQRVRKNRAYKMVEKYLGKDRVEVKDLYIAEILQDDYGYKTETVRRGPPKVWVMVL